MLMNSLANAMNETEFQQKFTSIFGSNGKNYVVEDKFDGVAIELVYEEGELVQGITRGDGRVGDDIFVNVQKMKFVKQSLPEKIDASIRGEVIMLKTDFERVNQLSDKLFANPRNAANGISKRFDGKFSEYLMVVVYDIISPDVSFSFETEKMDYLNHTLKLVTANYKLLTSLGVLDLRKQYMEKTRDTLPYNIDGLVVKVNSIQTQKTAGLYSNNDPKGQIAFKFDPRGVATVLKDIIPEVGRTGVITPNAVLEPINIDGAMVKAASLHNYDEIERLGVGIGDTVIVIKSGEIIPKITGVIKSVGKPAKAPTECPVCKSKLQKEGAYLKCVNPDCGGQEFRKLRHWIDVMKKRMDLEDIGESLIEQLNEKGIIHDPADFYKLTIEKIASLDRSGEKSATKIVNGLERCKEIDLITFLTALAIPTLGETLAELLADEYTLDQLLNDVTEADLSKIDNIGENRAKDILTGLHNRKVLIKKLKDLGVVIKKPEKMEIVSNKLANKSFQITGPMSKINPKTGQNYKREEFYDVVLTHGGRVERVGKGLDYLIVCRASGNKIAKAEKFGIKTISEDDFWTMVD